MDKIDEQNYDKKEILAARVRVSYTQVLVCWIHFTRGSIFDFVCLHNKFVSSSKFGYRFRIRGGGERKIRAFCRQDRAVNFEKVFL